MYLLQIMHHFNFTYRACAILIFNKHATLDINFNDFCYASHLIIYGDTASLMSLRL